MRAGSWPLRLNAVDAEEARRRAAERAESARTLALAKSVTLRAERVAAKVRHMNDLYRERLEGTRERS